MVNVFNLTDIAVKKTFFKKIGKIILEEENQDKEVSIVLVNSDIIRKLNRKYRKKNKITDVLSFDGGGDELGEIVICLTEVKKNSKKTDSGFKTELVTVFIHGLLHLLNYTHEESEKKFNQMELKQNYYLKKWQHLV
ncbi:MAG: rRNA maturation RNase YbeY [Patescibacteria group bacterium]|nr:rRNA maturation RNase YbeY [Patescibacteria group bacterium]MBU1877106.1 rRNA maturation RNase YbeY [Patescibacteria group bacterium]